MKMCVIKLLWFYIINAVIECAVLDPALYLSPNPPLMKTSEEPSAAELWSLPIDKRVQRDTQNLAAVSFDDDATEDLKESMKPAETFWPPFKNVDYRIRGIHIPLSLRVSGTYGNHETGVGIISTSFGTISGVTEKLKDQTSLAGNGYSRYQARYPGLRIYSRDNRPAWSGWGNGKWGHYGKGQTF